MKKGYQKNQRDKDGWRIPREGTLSRSIYDRLKRGSKTARIARVLGVDQNMVCVLAHRFRNPEWANNRRK